MASSNNDDGAFPVWIQDTRAYGDDGAFPILFGFGSAPPPDPQAKDFIAEILIGGQVVWSAMNQIPQNTLSIDVSKYEGIYEIEFRIRGLS